MAGQAHIVDVGGGDYIFGQHDGIVPQAEVVHAIGTFGYGEEGFAVGAFHAQHQQVAALPLDGSRVECRIHADALHEVGIGLLVQVVTPEDGRMCCRDYGVFVARDDAVAARYGFILSRDQLFVFLKQTFYLIAKCFHIISSYY